jgi:hypothetical protein
LNNLFKNNELLTRFIKYSQIIILVGLLAYVISIRISLSQETELISKSEPTVKWVQPSVLDEKFPVLIASNRWSINYFSIETILWRSKVSSSNRILIDSDTVELLDKITAELPGFINSEDMSRLMFLIEQSLPNSNAEKLAVLVNAYYSYQKEYKSQLKLLVEAVGEVKLSRLKDFEANNKQHQVQHFGADVAEVLFEKRNITTNYLNNRTIVNMDKELTKKQKHKRLLALKEGYAKTFSHQ